MKYENIKLNKDWKSRTSNQEGDYDGIILERPLCIQKNFTGKIIDTK